MKKAIFFVPSTTNIKENEFESCRNEGRILINNAFGLSLLNYECYIIGGWNIESPKKIWNNVYINSKYDINEVYDVAFAYSDSVPHQFESKKFKQKILINFEHSDILLKNIQEKGLDITLACPVPSLMKDPRAFHYQNENIHFLPILNPIPSVHIGFLPYTYKPKLPELKVYVHHSSWDGTQTRTNVYIHKQLLTLKFLKSKGYKLNVFFHMENEEAIKNSPFIESDYDEIHYINNDITYYDDVIKMIQKADLCIPNRAGYDAYGTSMFDIIGLGKSVINIVDGILRDDITVNNLYKCSEYLITVQEDDETTHKKLEKIIVNLEESYNCYRKQLEDFDFYNWKKYAEKILR